MTDRLSDLRQDTASPPPNSEVPDKLIGLTQLSGLLGAYFDLFQSNVEAVRSISREVERCLDSSLPLDVKSVNGEISSLINSMINSRNGFTREITLLSQNELAESHVSELYQGVMASFKEELRKLNTLKKEYRRRQSSQLTTYLRILSPEIDDNQIRAYLDEGSNVEELFSQQLYGKDSRKDSALISLRAMRELKHELKEIETSVSELLALFQEFELVVQSQNITISQIADNMEVTSFTTTRAVGELSEAAELANSARRTKALTGGVLACLGLSAAVGGATYVGVKGAGTAAKFAACIVQ